MALESVKELNELFSGFRILGIFEYYTVDSCSELEQFEYLIRTFLDIVLEVSGYIDAADPVSILVEDVSNILNGLSFTYRHGCVDVDMMTVCYVVKDVLKCTELCQRLSACKNYIVVRKDPVHEVKCLETSVKVKGRGVPILFLINTEWTCIIAVIRNKHGHCRTNLRKILLHQILPDTEGAAAP